MREPVARIVVSTRLHGSLAALLAGFPSIHLSYERKGWGAFEDLGLPQYVLNARDATFSQIEALAHRIRSDEDAYWGAVEAQRSTLASSRQQLLRAIRSAAGRAAA